MRIHPGQAVAPERRAGRRRHIPIAVAIVVWTLGASACVSPVTEVHRTSPAGHRGGAHSPAPAPAGNGAGSPTATTEPPVTATHSSPAHIYDLGRDVSDPFLTTWRGRYDLYVSENGLVSGHVARSVMNVPVTSARALGHWGPLTDALPSLPKWASPGFTWAPDVHRFGSTFVLYFTALVKGSSPAMECIGAATGSSPAGPFTPLGTPYICQTSQGGSIDPRVFTDSNGKNWMIWKSDQNIGGSSKPTAIWSASLSANGLHFTSTPTVIARPDEPWQGTIIESPNMVEMEGAYWLFYSGNWFNSSRYAIGVARCAGPMGPCVDSGAGPLVASNAQGSGPGEESVFSGPSGAWLLYTPWHSDSPNPDIPPRPVAMARIGFGPAGPYLATWSPPPSLAPASPRRSSVKRVAPMIG
ncbi:MAG: glycoside hydrolase family 43 protein [Acidimicrobiales bacterium]